MLWSENWVGCLCYVSLSFSPVCECGFPLPERGEELQVSPVECSVCGKVQAERTGLQKAFGFR